MSTKRAPGSDDPFRSVDEETAQSWLTALELRAQAPDQIRMRKHLLELGDVSEGHSVLEVGCGTGPLLCDVARAVGRTGRAYGVEPIPAFVRAASARIAREGLANVARVRAGDDKQLTERELDVCIEQTVLIHVPIARQHACLENLVATLRAGGRLVTADQDGDTWTIDHPDRELTRKIVRYNCDHRYADGWTGRRLRGLLQEVGLARVRVASHVHIDTERESYLFGMAERIAGAAREAQVIAVAEHERWIADLRERVERGLFFSSITYFLAVGTLGQPKTRPVE